MALFLGAISLISLTAMDANAFEEQKPTKMEIVPGDGLEAAVFGTGCFWCTEAVFERIDGVKEVMSGYINGKEPNPTYKAVCTGTTGYAEVVLIYFDPKKVSFEDLLSWFWASHDPTTLNRQGADVGTQYRSGVYYLNDAQKDAAEKSKKLADASGDFKDPIVTEIVAAQTFYKAEEYHQDFYRLNPANGYCRAVIAPKMYKLDPKKQPTIGQEEK